MRKDDDVASSQRFPRPLRKSREGGALGKEVVGVGTVTASHSKDGYGFKRKAWSENTKGPRIRHL